MRPPTITLTTDFGLVDHFAGSMKGVILSIEPGANIVDISHQIEPYAITEAAFAISQAYGCFPPGSVHLVVVDPGVGTSRRALLVEAGRHYFVAPDNGVLSMVYAQEKCRVREVTADRFFRKPVSRTFHGRDIFAPVAAHLAHGIKPTRFGRLISDYEHGDFSQPVAAGKGCWTGVVLKADRFGNLITNFPAARYTDLRTGSFEIRCGRRRITTYVSSYADGQAGQPFVIAGSSGFLEIAANKASAAEFTGCGAGAKVWLTSL